MTKIRILTGVSAAAVLVILVLFGHHIIVAAVVAGFLFLALEELDPLLFEEPNSFRKRRQFFLVFLALFWLKISEQVGLFGLWVGFFSVFLTSILFANKTGKHSKGLNESALELLEFVYLFSMFGFLLPIYLIDKLYLLLLFMAVFGGDTAAYFVGRKLGKKKLAKKLSPGKTVEGAIAGVFGSVGMFFLWGYCFRPMIWSNKEGVWFLIAVIIMSVLGQLGDLFESLLKRNQEKKDSGSFLPGHGGVLDRIDGLVFSSPFFYFFLKYWLVMNAK